jgi:putative toxin-antitoxin system, antitoxin component, abrB famil
MTMIEKKKAASTTANLLNNRSKDSKSSRIIQQVRSIFLSGRKVTAKEINAETNSNDARRVISTLRKEGWNIKDVRLDDKRKLYWLEPDKRQMSIDWEGGTK